jgi:1-acyl-sn-glycerol-3-phosphate acyltransferase
MPVAVRSLLFFAWMVVTVIPWGLAVVVASPFLRSDALYWMCARWLAVAMWGCRTICGVRSRIHGMDNLPPADRQSPVILLSKHQSTWETFTYPTIMSHPLAYVFKRELLYIPFFGWAMGRLDMIHIDRSKRNQAFGRVVAQGQRILANGSWIIMFPEGTRTPRGGQGTYKTGGARLALATGAPVVPIACTSARCWPRKTFLVRPGIVDVSIGKPIAVEGRSADELMREVEAWIEAEMRRLDAQAYPPSTAATPS